MLEIPAGAIEPYENVYETLRREITEETNLDVVRLVDDYHGEIVEPRANDQAFAFKPYICQQVLATNNGLPWIGFVFLCEVTGEVKIQESEARDPRWVSLEELRAIVEEKPESVFPVQLPVLKYFVENFKD